MNAWRTENLESWKLIRTDSKTNFDQVRKELQIEDSKIQREIKEELDDIRDRLERLEYAFQRLTKMVENIKGLTLMASSVALYFLVKSLLDYYMVPFPL